MNEERVRILDMVASGKISVSEAEALIDALTRDVETAESSGELVPSGDMKRTIPKFFRVTVDSKNGDNIDVRIPFSLMRAGIRLSSLMPPAAAKKVNEHLGAQGVEIDLNNMKKEDVDEILSGLSEMEINIDSSSGDKIRVFCE